MDLSVLVAPGVNSREALAPTEVLVDQLGIPPREVGLEIGVVQGHDPPHRFEVSTTVESVSAGVLVVPGGFGALDLAGNPRLVGWLDDQIAAGAAVLAISTGCLPVAATGRLRGRRVAGHWLCDRHVRAYGCLPTRHPIETSGRVVTTSGTAAALGGAEFIADLVRWGAGSTWEETVAGT